MKETASSQSIVRFGVFEVDLRAGELRRQGLKIRLQGQPFQVLAMLLDHAGEVVTREDLQKALWPADTFVDFDHGLNKAITKIREALGDSAESPRYVETLPRKGYRFIGILNGIGGSAVAETTQAAGKATAVVPQPALALSRNAARGLFLVIQAGYLAMYAAAFYHLHGIQRLAPNFGFKNLAIVVALCALCGAALRLYLFSAVGFDYPGSGRLFRSLFPAVLALDLAWAASPLLLFIRLGELVLLFVAGLAFLPFAQRTLLSCAYLPPGGKTSPCTPAA